MALILLEPSSSYASPVDDSTSGAQTCDVATKEAGKPEAALALTLNAESDAVSFKCSSTHKATIAPSNADVYNDDSCTSVQTLATLFTDAAMTGGEGDDEPKTYTLTIPKNSRKATETLLCYKCILDAQVLSRELPELPQAEGNVCKVKITVAAVPKKEPEADKNDDQPEGVFQCASEDGTKEASVSAESPLLFKCGSGLSLQPTNLENVFDDQDGTCADEVALDTVVDATLTQAETNTNDPEQTGAVYQLVVKTAPSEDTALCYKCVPASAAPENRDTPGEGSTLKECLLKIFVKGNATSASERTWGASLWAVSFPVAVQTLVGVLYVSE
ncbi:SRS domain-containing protein [Neospora caninum Liverpool]|uniref:SRS domain-containing protein n=1 Tax=Neospora caninum (strain Liverpool) TaxID=572307 RepID=F0VL96_NEOCL|nr:SRS domain-containing protein [Neospora caninum Liverpool]CBZ54848.1 SRS domain-containing protein [Neospora caninum Liverpool]CEL69567.1 TPA: SRS domain-containing protein [Neospora caninum Liverpool]|eukprot:XP_003884876.1 SRS domain-containing protein [Neospora caninum Liverpool]